MKKVLLATVLSCCVSSAFAAETAVLKVTGTLTNAACTPELSNGGIVNYGTISLGDLSATDVNQLGQKNIDLTITCSAASKVSWSMVDDRADSWSGVIVKNATANGLSQNGSDSTFGVGKAGEVNIGSYAMFVNVGSVTADGTKVDSIVKDNGESSWRKITDGATLGNSHRNTTVAKTGTTEPLAFQTATFPLTTSLAIQNTTLLAITDDTQLDGQLTISINYL